jgi:FtsH-binding integral membrane protein
MVVQPWFPEQVTVPNNVAESEYGVRIQFLRKVGTMHFLSLVGVLSVRFLGLPQVPLEYIAALILGCLALLNTARRIKRGGSLDRMLSVLLFPPIAFGYGLLIVHPPISFLWYVSATCAVGSVGYLWLCGWDFSFTGQFTIVSLLSIGGLIAARYLGYVSPGHLGWAILSVLVLQFYYDYDLASILRRRVAGEEWPAAMDLYRDVLNFLTYGIRVIYHWRTFNI